MEIRQPRWAGSLFVRPLPAGGEPVIVDLFAGPGGWSEGLRLIGLEDVGLEWDEDACRTRAAAGHRTIRCDVSRYPPDAFTDVEGMIASPPCTAFSMAGKGEGREEVRHLHEAVEACRGGWTAPDREWLDETTPLVLEPLRWTWELRPAWVACEQVPPVLPLWEHMADVLREWGYDARAVKLHSEQWGVPQTRTRAFLLAHRDGVRLPTPTHQRYRHGEAAGEAQECQPGLFGPGLRPWVSMAEALGWTGEIKTNQAEHDRPKADDGSQPCYAEDGSDYFYRIPTDRPCWTVSHNISGWKVVGNNSVAGEGRAERNGDEPALTVGSRADLWSLRMRGTENATTRPAPAPAPTVAFGHDAAAVQWVRGQRRNSGPAAERDPRSLEDPSYTIRSSGSGSHPSGCEWVRTRPATTVQADPRLGRPGHKDRSSDGEPMFAEDSVRIQVHEAAILQGFCPLYPWQGSKTSRFSQIGNAVCPPWAAAIIGALTGRKA